MINPESCKALVALREAWAILVFYCESTPIIKIFSSFLRQMYKIDQEKNAKISVGMPKIRSRELEEQSMAVSTFTPTDLSLPKSLRPGQARNPFDETVDVTDVSSPDIETTSEDRSQLGD